MSDAIVVLSGGMDSTTAAYWANREYDTNIELISFDYGQRHKKELNYAQDTSAELDAPLHIVDLTSVSHLIQSSALTSPDTDVPEGHYANETMSQTVVPNRNSMMLNIAIARAVSVKAEAVVTGVHAGDHPVYPDCRPEFIDLLGTLAHTACEGHIHPDFVVEAPFVESTKAMIVAEGERLDVPWQNTWSCYKGYTLHCGRCSTCCERAEAFYLANVEDPTEYADTEFWKEVCGI